MSHLICLCWSLQKPTVFANSKFLEFCSNSNFERFETSLNRFNTVIESVRLRTCFRTDADHFAAWCEHGKRFSFEITIGGWKLGSIPTNFKILVLNPNLSFLLENHRNDNKGEFPDFNESTLYMTFKIFENGHFDNGYFCEKFQKSYIGWIRKNPRIHPSYLFCDFLQKWQLLL